MPPHTLASLAHALSAATDLDAAFVALTEALAEMDRGSRLALFRLDAKRDMLCERALVADGAIDRAAIEASLDQFPKAVGRTIAAGGVFADLEEESPGFARMLALPHAGDADWLSVIGLRVDGQLAGVIALLELRRSFGTRVSERFAPMVALFQLAFLRFAERDARLEAVQTLEETMQKVHGDYVARLAAAEDKLLEAQSVPRPGAASDAARLSRERDGARAIEETRRATRKLVVLEQQLTASVGALEQAHVELHRKNEALRQRTRTLYLLDRVLTLAAAREEPRRLAEGLLALVGDDMQAQRCSLFLLVPGDSKTMYLAAARGLAPHVKAGSHITVGQGVAGKVAESREPLLVMDAGEDALRHPLLGDEYLTTGSFISFPLVLHDELLGVLNITNRAQHGVFVEDDIERVRLLGMVISLIAREVRLPERLHEMIADGQ
ncbi:MAG TPA: GAF domain-containing protein [Gemmatimonadaceae bacterium]